jgi:putative peptidoglycan lipid II flippase
VTARGSSFRLAGLIGGATILSKVIALVRDQLIAYSFGTSAGVDAFNIAYKLPGFMLTLLGGVNGPFYSAVVSVIGRRGKKRLGPLIETINTLTLVLMGLVAGLLWVGAPLLVGLVAQGASALVQSLAVEQLRIMAPMAVLAGLIGVGFGVLTSAGRFALPTLSPIFSSLAVILALLLFGSRDPNILAWGVLVGAVAQWLAQIPLQWKLGLGGLRLRWHFRTRAVREFVGVMAPASGSSLLSNINVYTDLYFASGLAQGVIAALGYANLLVQAPLGILSNILLIPALPAFSRLTAPDDRPELRRLLRQTLVTVLILVLPLSALTIALCVPVVAIIYERGRFGSEDTRLVAALLAGAALGMVFYLARDLVIRVFYALGEAQLPLRVSLIGIVANLVLDWLLIRLFGPIGLPLATTGVSALACLLLVLALRRRLGRLGWSGLGGTALYLVGASLLSGGASWQALALLTGWWPFPGTLADLVRLAIAATCGLAVCALWIGLLPNKEVREMLGPLARRLLRRRAERSRS